jgi:hypothetical protein
MNNKTPKCLWCKDVTGGAPFCDVVCRNLHQKSRLHRVEPVALVREDFVSATNSDEQYHGERASE